MSWTMKFENFKATGAGDQNLFQSFLDNNDIKSWNYVYSENDYQLKYTIEKGRQFSFGVGSSIYLNANTERLKFIDHARMFKNYNGDVIMVSQPYVTEERISQFYNDEWQQRTGLDVYIYPAARSWYYPNNTTIFAIVLRGRQKPII